TTCSYALNMFPRATTASINCSASGLTFSLLAASLDAPFPCSRGFRPLPSGWDSGISAILSASLRIAKFKRQSFLRVRAFGLVAKPTMPSADFCHLIAPPLGVASTRQDGRSPRVLRTHFPAYARRIYVKAFRAGIGL